MRISLRVKLLLTLVTVGVAASIAGLGTFASFTSSTAAQSQNLATGTVSITLGTANRLTVGASNLVPGDTIQRAVDITNDGSAGTSSVGSISLTTAATTSSQLDADTSAGLQLNIDKCSVAWTESGPPYTYTCGGATSVVVASRAVLGTDVALSNMSSVTAGSSDHLRVTLTLPGSAGNSLQGQSSTIAYTFTANQRAAASK
jgi:spore coat-associated protein N